MLKRAPERFLTWQNLKTVFFQTYFCYCGVSMRYYFIKIGERAISTVEVALIINILYRSCY